MPSVKMTEFIDLAERNIATLKAGDPAWTRQQKNNAKAAVTMLTAFKVLAAERCTDAVQSVPTWPGVRARVAAGRKPARGSIGSTAS